MPKTDSPIYKEVRVFPKVFVLATEVTKVGAEWEFLPEDQYGALHGEIRVAAAQVLRDKGLAKKLYVTGGKTIDGIRHGEVIAKKIGGNVTCLENLCSTQGDIFAIKRHWREYSGILTNFYHLPRAMQLAAEENLNLAVPICAEAVLLAYDKTWEEKIRDMYSQPSMVKRIGAEVLGMSRIGFGKYVDHGPKKGTIIS